MKVLQSDYPAVFSLLGGLQNIVTNIIVRTSPTRPYVFIKALVRPLRLEERHASVVVKHNK